jgi:hypothetical protein
MRITMVGKNTNGQTSSNDDSKMSLAQRAATMPDVATFTAWLDDPKNYTKERQTKLKDGSVKVLPPMRQPLSLSANVPDDIYYRLVQEAVKRHEDGKYQDGDTTYIVRKAAWLMLGYTEQEYDDWAKAEAERIREAQASRMSGLGSERAGAVAAVKAENLTLKEQLEKAMAALAAAGVAVD